METNNLNDIIDLCDVPTIVNEVIDIDTYEYSNKCSKSIDLTNELNIKSVDENYLIHLINRLKVLTNINDLDLSKSNKLTDDVEVITQNNTSNKRSAGYSINQPSNKKYTKFSLGWAKGVGYGRGHNTTNTWDANKYIQDQQKKEQNIIDILSKIIDELLKMKSGDDYNNQYLNIMKFSCFIPFLESYLNNDSILELERHVDIYLSIFEILNGLASVKELKVLLLPFENRSESIAALVDKIKHNLEIYTKNSLKQSNYKSNNTTLQPINLTQSKDNQSNNNTIFSDAGISLLTTSPKLLRIHEIAIRVTSIYNKYLKNIHKHENIIVDLSDGNVCNVIIKSPDVITSSSKLNKQSDKNQNDIESTYLNTMKPLKYNEIPVLSNYYYKGNLGSVDTAGNIKSRIRRLAQDHADLSSDDSSLISWSSSVWIRSCEERMDTLQMMISGPEGTPYSNGLFLFDVFFPASYPSTPPQVNLQTTGKGTVRFNPNLYNSGKVCLSLLGTWQGSKSESWDEKISTFRQVIISIQSLILVPEPYFNEPGYDSQIGSTHGTKQSNAYNIEIQGKNMIWGMTDHMKYPKIGFEEVIKNHFKLKRNEIMEQVMAWSHNHTTSQSKSTINELTKQLNLL